MKQHYSGKFHEPRWSWTSSAVDANAVAHMGMDGRISVADLLKHMAEIEPGIPPEEIMLNWTTVKWERPATEEERAEREARGLEHKRRTETWERKKLAELKEKYEGETE